MFGSGLGHGGSLVGYLAPLGLIVLVVMLRNRRARRLRIERLWVLPAVYMLLLAASLSATPPELTPLGIGLLAAGLAIGAMIGWQRARFTQIDIDPQTHELSSRASPIGLIFIVGVLALRLGARGYLAENAASLHLPIVAVGDAFLAMAIGVLAAQRLEIWIRASRMLAAARAATSVPSPRA